MGATLQPLLVRATSQAFPWMASVKTAPAPAAPCLSSWLSLPECFVFALLGATLALAMRGTAVFVVFGLFLMLFAQAPLGWW